MTAAAVTASPFSHAGKSWQAAAWQTTKRRRMHFESDESWQLLGYIHSMLYMTIQWDSGGGPTETHLGTEHTHIAERPLQGAL